MFFFVVEDDFSNVEAVRDPRSESARGPNAALRAVFANHSITDRTLITGVLLIKRYAYS